MSAETYCGQSQHPRHRRNCCAACRNSAIQAALVPPCALWGAASAQAAAHHLCCPVAVYSMATCPCAFLEVSPKDTICEQMRLGWQCAAGKHNFNTKLAQTDHS